MYFEQSSPMLLNADRDHYEVRPRKDRDGFDLINKLFRYGPIWYSGPDAVRYAIAYAKYRSHSRSHRAIIRVLDDSGAVVQMHE
jgi:hemerythrin